MRAKRPPQGYVGHDALGQRVGQELARATARVKMTRAGATVQGALAEPNLPYRPPEYTGAVNAGTQPQQRTPKRPSTAGGRLERGRSQQQRVAVGRGHYVPPSPFKQRRPQTPVMATSPSFSDDQRRNRHGVSKEQRELEEWVAARTLKIRGLRILGSSSSDKADAEEEMAAERLEVEHVLLRWF